MQNNPEAIRQAKELARSESGQQLLRMLQNQNGQELNQAMKQASAGDYAAAKAILTKLMQDPQAQALLKQLGGCHGSDGR